MASPYERFIRARDFLQRHRTDYATAYRDYAQPELDEFNWALDFFDVQARGNATPALWVVEEDGSVIWHGFMTDVTERKQIEAELQAFATTDFLTQLANRRHFMHRLEAELARLQRSPEQSAAILMFDLDYFKAINDRWGHNVGDQALRHFAAILSSQLRRTDTAGRLGGEEFAVVLSEASLDKAMHFAARIQRHIERKSYLVKCHGESCGCCPPSSGFATFSHQGRRPSSRDAGVSAFSPRGRRCPKGG